MFRKTAKSQSLLLKLPVELLLGIGDEVYLVSGRASYKDLRLVCQLLDRVFAPIVLANIRILDYGHMQCSYASKYEQFCALTRGSDRMPYVKSITLDNWNWIYEPLNPSWWPVTESAKRSRWRSILPRLHALLGAVPHRISETRCRDDAKHRVQHVEDVCFQLPNVECVKWFISRFEHEQSVRLNAHVLRTLPSLTELDLLLPFPEHGSMRRELETEISTAFSTLHNLSKITLRMLTGELSWDNALDWLKQVIKHSPKLVHIMLYQSGALMAPLANFPALFDGVPTDRPLQLQRLRLSSHFYQLTDQVLPHIRSLSSLSLCFQPLSGDPPIDDAWKILRVERIYLSEIHTNRISLPLLDYLRDFTHLTSLSLWGRGKGSGQNVKVLFEILAQHMLRRLRLDPFDWEMWFHRYPFIEMSFMEYSYLQKLVLHSGYRSQHDILQVGQWWRSYCISLEALALLLARIDPSVTVIMEGASFAYDKLRDICRASSSVRMRELGERVLHSNTPRENYDFWEEYHWSPRLPYSTIII